MKKILIFFVFSSLFVYAENGCNDYAFSYKKQFFSVCNTTKDSLIVKNVNGTKIRTFDYGDRIYFVGPFDEISSFFKEIGFHRKQNGEKKSTDLLEYAYKKIEASNMEYLLTTKYGYDNLPYSLTFGANEVVFIVRKQVNPSKKRKTRMVPIY